MSDRGRIELYILLAAPPVSTTDTKDVIAGGQVKRMETSLCWVSSLKVKIICLENIQLF